MMKTRQPQGLTLFELVVVLAILSAVTMAASVATDRVLMQKRHDVTQQTLDAFRRSVLGRFGHTESISTVSLAAQTPTIDGFIADVGRLPITVGTDPATQLVELWSNPLGLMPYGLKVAAGDPEVAISCGWRGPYLDLPSGAQGLRDGWGRNLLVLTRDSFGAPVAAGNGQPIWGVSSLGSDGAVGVVNAELPLAEDAAVWFGASLSQMQSDLVVRVFESDGAGGRTSLSQSGSVMVRLYLPDSASGGLTFQQSPLLTTPAPITFTFPAVPIGPKVLRAYWVSDNSVAVKSTPTPIDVRRAGQATFDLVLPTLPITP
jgi:prepilin-type N-terminal cleavage/methylation domain-containing protein